MVMPVRLNNSQLSWIKSLGRIEHQVLRTRCCLMSDLLQRLTKLHVEAPTEDEDLHRFSMAQFQEMKIDFGTAHKGKSYQSVWQNHQSWVKWFLQHYGESKKPSHRRVVHYFGMEIERAELANQTIPLTDVATPAPKSQVKPKAKAKSQPTSTSVEPVDDFHLINEIAEEFEMDPTELMLIQGTSSQEVAQLNQRMTQMESMLSQTVQHLQGAPRTSRSHGSQLAYETCWRS